MRPDVGRVAEIIAQIAQTEISPRYKNLPSGSIREKQSATDFVTVADEAAERALQAALLDLVPGSIFIGEEAAAAAPSITGLISSAPTCWIVDPLDGTRNFVNGVDEFGTIVAYVECGRTIAGWIYAIPQALTATSVRGEGVLIDCRRPSPAPQKTERPKGLRSAGWLRGPWRDRIVRNLKRNVDSRPGACSAYAYLKLISGEVDFLLSSRVHVWDHAAGALMLEELGGSVRWLDDGSAYAPGESFDRPLLAAAPGRRWQDVADRLLA